MTAYNIVVEVDTITDVGIEIEAAPPGAAIDLNAQWVGAVTELQVQTLVDAAKAQLVNGASPTMDQFNEVEAALSNKEASGAAAIAIAAHLAASDPHSQYQTQPESDARYIRTVNGTGPDATGNVTVSTGGSATWGGIAGTLSSQSDLQAALNAKANSAFTHPLIGSPPIVTSLQTLHSEGLSLSMVASGPLGAGQDATTALQRLAAECANLGFTGRIGRGTFAVSDTIVFDEGGDASVLGNRGGLVGDGSGTKLLVTANINALDLRGGVSGGITPNARFSDFMLYRQGLAKNGTALKLDNYTWSDFERIMIYGFDIGITATDALSSSFRRITIRDSVRGMIFTHADFSRPNALTFADIELGLNSEFGAYFDSPTTLNWVGGAVEGCGVGGTGAFGFQGGIKLVNGGQEGAVGASLRSVYFEHNKGQADIDIDSTQNTVAYGIEGCTFNRLVDGEHVTNNIKIAVGGTAQLSVGISRSAFHGYGSYIESAARPYIAASDLSKVSVVVDSATIFKSDLAYVDPATWGSATRPGIVSEAGGGTLMPRAWTVGKVGTGIYTVTHNLGTTKYGVTATSQSVNPVLVERVIADANSFTVVTTSPNGTLADAGFSFVLARH